jgi:hypothetical protein
MKFTATLAALAALALPAFSVPVNGDGAATTKVSARIDGPLANSATPLSKTFCANKGPFQGDKTLADAQSAFGDQVYFGAHPTAACGSCFLVLNPANKISIPVVIVDHVAQGFNVGIDGADVLMEGETKAGVLSVQITPAPPSNCGVQ